MFGQLVGYEELLFTAECENLVRKEICYEPYGFIYFPPGAASAAPFLVREMANGCRMEYNYGKTHDMGVEHGKQAEKPTPEANRHESEEKLGVEARW